MTGNRLCIGPFVCGILVSLMSGNQDLSGAASPPDALHSEIDRIVESAQLGTPVGPANDSEFLRRVSLDLTGMPPSASEVREFLADNGLDKRAKAIDRLLESPPFARQWAITLDVMLMERRPSVNVTADEWQNYLLAAVRGNRPLNQVIAEILRADGADSKLRAAARFYLDRGSEPNLITRDVGRIFFGRDLQCAQCHDHPLVKDYHQSDYYGLLAFFSPGYALTRKEGSKETTYYAEKAGSDLAFDSVFVKNDRHLTGPRIPGGTELAEPVFPPGDEYKVKPGDTVLPVPRFSRRAELASLATGGTNRAFNENIANRLWAAMMGRGVVHPVDLHHPANPPSQPELLKLLGDGIAALKFDVKLFVRELALTRAYQRAIDRPAETSPLPGHYAVELAKLKARSEALETSAERARVEFSGAVKAWHHAEFTLVPLAAEHDKAILKHTEATKKHAEAQKAVSELNAKIAACRETAPALAEIAERAGAVAAKLPKEKGLADAVRTFVNRSKAAAAELKTLEKARSDKSALLEKGSEEVASATKSVAAIRTKVEPVRDSVRQKEKLVQETRRRMAQGRISVEEHQKRIAFVEAHALYQSLREQAVAIDRALVARRDALAIETKDCVAVAAIIERDQVAAHAADRARRAAERTLIDARTTLFRHQKAAVSVSSALAATEAAQQHLPADSKLREAISKLKASSDELAALLSGRRAHVEAAGAALTKAELALRSSERTLKESRDDKARRDARATAARAALDAETARRDVLRAQLADATDELTGLLGNRFALAQLKPLTPEQLCFSILKVTGVYDRDREAQEAELGKAKPLIGAAANDPVLKRARAIEVEQRTYAKLKGNVAPFVSMYAAGPGQGQSDFFATADQALFAANGGPINSWIAPQGGNVSQRMIQEKDPKKIADDLYLSVLSRLPTAEESADVARVLAAQSGDKPAAVAELVWGLLTSIEFRFNH
jgi:hypothetical protein